MTKPTVVLIHGWSFENYSGVTDRANVWDGNPDLIRLLSQHFHVAIFNFPGFCISELPDRAWRIDDFAQYVEDFLVQNIYHPVAVLGFSFGGAVAVRWKRRFVNTVPLLLVSPAISRSPGRQRFLAILKLVLPVPLIASLKEWLKVRVLGNSRYKLASRFVKETYLNIVTEELSADLLGLKPQEVRILFGSDDLETPAELLIKKLPSKWLSRITVIPNGRHNIIETYRNDVVSELISLIADQ